MLLSNLHELKGPDRCEEVLLRLVARHVLLQGLRALCELKIFHIREQLFSITANYV